MDLMYSILDFKGFSKLTSLRMTGLQGDLLVWKDTIAHMLVSSPGLTDLGLSISHREFEALSSKRETIYNFLVDLSNHYGDLGYAPLRLKTLKLYHPIPFRLDAEGSFGYIEKLTDLHSLRELRIFNQCVYIAGEDVSLPEEGVTTAWSAIGPKTMPNLRQLSVAEWNESFLEWFDGLDTEYASQLGLRADTQEIAAAHSNALDLFLRPNFGKTQKVKRLVLPKILQPEDTEDFTIDWEAWSVLESCHWISAIGFDIDSDLTPIRLVDILAEMEGLQELAITHVISKRHCGNGAWARRRLGAEYVAAKCKRLKYLSLYGRGMRIGRPPTEAVEIEYLEKSEDEVMGAFFHEDAIH